jgi:hypothetical protein
MAVPLVALYEVYTQHCRDIRRDPVAIDEFAKNVQGRGFRLSYYREGAGPVMELINGLSLNASGLKLLARAGWPMQELTGALPQPRVQRGRR